jgi:hypothetical protein
MQQCGSMAAKTKMIAVNALAPDVCDDVVARRLRELGSCCQLAGLGGQVTSGLRQLAASSFTSKL